MTPHQMTEPEAWREIARRIVEGKWEGFGLCNEVLRLYGEDRTECAELHAMYKRVRQHVAVSPDSPHWAYPAGTEPEARALAALWLALEAEEEGA
jgi:hypothetical protein